MILEMNGRPAGVLTKPARMGKGRGGNMLDAAEQWNELMRVEAEIGELMGRTQALAEELGAKYAAFRAGRRQKSAPNKRSRDMIELSRKADDCIDRIYTLERKRRELLGKVCLQSAQET